MGVEIRYEVDGRTVSQDQFFAGIEGKIRQMAVDEITRRVEGVRCPEHGNYARVSDVRQTDDGVAFEVAGCCDALVQQAQRAATAS